MRIAWDAHRPSAVTMESQGDDSSASGSSKNGAIVALVVTGLSGLGYKTPAAYAGKLAAPKGVTSSNRSGE